MPAAGSGKLPSCLQEGRRGQEFIQQINDQDIVPYNMVGVFDRQGHYLVRVRSVPLPDLNPFADLPVRIRKSEESNRNTFILQHGRVSGQVKFLLLSISTCQYTSGSL